jgi:NADH-quinone oxidoreductase subunit G
MEGANGPNKSGALLPFVWSPGWNSNQSLHKFQSEAGGALSGGTAGVRLIEAGQSTDHVVAEQSGKAFEIQQDVFRLLPLHQIFGSDELSARSPAIAEMTANPSIKLLASDANNVGLADGDIASMKINDCEVDVIVNISSSIPQGCAAYTVGVPGSEYLPANTSVAISRSQAAESGGANE